MGCGWTAKIDFGRIEAVEVINGGVSVGPLAGLGFWEARLNAGFQVTAVGGSDNHDATLPADRAPSVGRPTTVVYALALSQDAVLAGLRAGHAFVDVLGTRDRQLEVEVQSGAVRAQMGDRLLVTGDLPVRLNAHVAGATGGRLAFGGPAAAGLISPAPLTEDDHRALDLPAGATGWLRVDVLGPDGSLWLLGNPIYLARAP